MKQNENLTDEKKNSVEADFDPDSEVEFDLAFLVKLSFFLSIFIATLSFHAKTFSLTR